jgi:hypothetical protein
MYVRIARFEAAEGSEPPIEEIRKRMKEGMGGPVQRGLMLVDRESGRGASVVFCETEEDLRRVDESMNSMTPAGAGRRASVEMYEVVLDSDNL